MNDWQAQWSRRGWMLAMTLGGGGVAVSSVGAQRHPGHAPPRGTATSRFGADMHTAMVAMVRDMGQAPMTDDPDRDFLAMMIPHHEGAVAMAKPCAWPGSACADARRRDHCWPGGRDRVDAQPPPDFACRPRPESRWIPGPRGYPRTDPGAEQIEDRSRPPDRDHPMNTYGKLSPSHIPREYEVFQPEWPAPRHA